MTEPTNTTISKNLIPKPKPVELQQAKPKLITKNPKRVAAGQKLAAHNKEYKEWLKNQDVAKPHEVNMQGHVQQSAVDAQDHVQRVDTLNHVQRVNLQSHVPLSTKKSVMTEKYTSWAMFGSLLIGGGVIAVLYFKQRGEKLQPLPDSTPQHPKVSSEPDPFKMN